MHILIPMCLKILYAFFGWWGFRNAESVVIASSPRLKPDELDTQEVMLSARDRPDDELDPAGAGRPSFCRR